MPQPRILVTGATGQLGALAIGELLKTVPVADIAGLVRPAKDGAPSRAERLLSGVAARIGDYTDPASLRAAMQGIERLLFVSSSELDGRVAQHRNVVEAAAHAGVRLIA